MEKTKKTLTVGLMVGLISLMASPAFARSISLNGAGATLWIFIIVGAIVVLLQLIPATILFFSFVGTTAPIAFKKGKRVEGEAILPGAEPMVVKR